MQLHVIRIWEASLLEGCHDRKLTSRQLLLGTQTGRHRLQCLENLLLGFQKVHGFGRLTPFLSQRGSHVADGLFLETEAEEALRLER